MMDWGAVCPPVGGALCPLAVDNSGVRGGFVPPRCG